MVSIFHKRIHQPEFYILDVRSFKITCQNLFIIPPHLDSGSFSFRPDPFLWNIVRIRIIVVKVLSLQGNMQH